MASTSKWSLAILLLLCLSLFLGCVAASWNKPLVGDLVPYLWWARMIVETGVPLIVFNPDEPTYPGNMHPPLYPYLVALSFRLFGDGVRSSVLVNLTAFLGTLALSAAVARRLGAPPIGIGLLLAGLLVHPFAIQSTLLTDTDTSLVPLGMLAYTWLLLASQDRMTAGATLLLGVMFGACLWTKFATPLSLPVVTAFYLALRGQLTKGVRAGAVILVVGVTLFLATHALFALATGLSPWEPIAWPATKARADLAGNVGRVVANVLATLKTDVLWFTPPFVLLVLVAFGRRLHRYARDRRPEDIDLIWILGGLVYFTYTVVIPTDGRPRYKTITLILFALATVVTLLGEVERRPWSRRAQIATAIGLLGLLGYYAWLPEPIATATLLSPTADGVGKARLVALHGLPIMAVLAVALAPRQRRAVMAALVLVFAATAVVTDLKQARASAPNNLFGFGLDGFEETVEYVRTITRPGELIFSFSDLPYYTRNGFYNYSVFKDGRRTIDVERLRQLAAQRSIRLLVFEIHPLRFGPELFATPEVRAFLQADFCLLRRFGNHYVYGSREAGLCAGRVGAGLGPG